MRKLYLIIIAGIFLICSSGLRAQISIGGYNAYYGHLHNHTAYSDGQGTPPQAYAAAKANGLDFFGLAEHSNLLNATEWSRTLTVADSMYLPGVFTTFRGFEWTTSAYGHVAVINTPTLIDATNASYNTFTELITWLNTQDQNCFAFFNHPGDYNNSGTEFDHFPSNLATDKIVGMEFWNKSVSFTRYYASLAGVMVSGFFSGDNMPFYDEALQRNWKIAPEGSEDNHTANWGSNGYEYKTGVLAAANNRADILAAFKARRFFSTLDKNTAISFKLNGSEMGSTITGGTCTLQILAADGDSETFSKVELLKKGVVVNTWTPGVTNVNITGSISGTDGDYFYIRVYQSGNLTAVSAPIWIVGGTVNVPPAVNITSPATASQFEIPATITITADASDTDGTVTKVEFYQGTTLLGTDTSAPYSFTWSSVPAGSYSLTAKATDNLGSVTVSTAVAITVYDPNAPITVSSVIATGNDDAEESDAGVIYLASTDIELVYDSYNTAGNQVVGLRFTNLNIPKSAGINNAYIQFTCDEVSTAACSLTIKGEAADNPVTFASTTGNISSRAKTTASVAWVPATWPTADVAGVDQQTPGLASIIQEIVNRSGYTSASAIGIIITGTGSRIAEAYEGVPASAAKLVVEYSLVQQVTPTFTQIGPLCQNSTAPALPLNSNNGITGTWSPSAISTSSAGSTVYTFTPAAGQNATTATMTIVVNAPVVPAFTAVGPYCYGASIPALPTTSTNGITGTWSPAINNTVTTLYTFTPTVGQCATTVTMTVVINPNVTPTFNAAGPYCAGATIPALPTTSTNGITGTWSPAINNTATTLYTFTPTAGQCATTATMTVVINPNVTPTFNAAGPYCAGSTIPALPTTSTNGITGSWSPAINNTVTTLYTFTPTAGQCATTATLTIVISPNITPTFSAVGAYCAGAAIPALPALSLNGFTGAWSPAINNLVTTTYTFTPDAGQCAATATLTIVINQPVVPLFAQLGPLCQNSTPPALPATSTNRIDGTWNPATISTENMGTTTYLFTPDAGQCAQSTSMDITVSDPVQPLFLAVGPYCSGATIPALPLISENGISGTWSPELNNSETTVYTFTPNAGQCATAATLTVVIVPNVTPAFDPVGPFCAGSAIDPLPNVSTNGISGTWSPAVNNAATTTYTFTPSAGQCATTASMTIVITAPVTPTFVQVGPYCAGDVIPALPLVSTNVISGTWSPAINNLATTTYTFTPDAGQCATTASMTIVVNQKATPTFSAIGPFVQGSTPPALPASSLNGFTGTWAPSAISTATTGTFAYVFTPDAGQCALPATVNITITPSNTPPAVSITAPTNGKVYTNPASVAITATATDGDGTVTKVDFYQGATLLGTDTSSPYSYTWSVTVNGTYSLTAVATDDDGALTTSASVSISVVAPTIVTLSKRIASGIDDVEEYSSGTMNTTSDDIELVYDNSTTKNQIVGLRFQSLTMPQGAVITNAYIQFQVDEVTTASASLTIRGQNVDNAAQFTTVKKNVSSRVKTTASVAWVPATWPTVGAVGTAQQTPDLKTIVQEIVNRTGWASGNSMVFIVTGTGKRTAESYEGLASGAAQLNVQYYVPLKTGVVPSMIQVNSTDFAALKGNLSCYPNPFRNELNIEFQPSENEVVGRVEVFNSAGNLVRTVICPATHTVLKLADVQPGIYLVRLVTDRHSYTQTVIKN